MHSAFELVWIKCDNGFELQSCNATLDAKEPNAQANTIKRKGERELCKKLLVNIANIIIIISFLSIVMCNVPPSVGRFSAGCKDSRCDNAFIIHKL